MKQKKFIDIENLKTNETEMVKANDTLFLPNDIVYVQEKVDGSNASVCWDEENNRVAAFSRRQELTFNNTLNGFYNYVQTLPEKFTNFLKDHPELVFFGEWNLGGNKIKDYSDEYMRNTWIVYDIYDKDKENYLPQSSVIDFCKMFDLTYIHILYVGKFINWDNIRQFLHKNSYGGTQEGIVIKNNTAMESGRDKEMRAPAYLKIVNKEFSEKMTHTKRKKTAEELEGEATCKVIVDEIVTQRRVEKGIERLRDDGILPAELTPKDMKLVAQHLPKEIYNDCLKEEKDLVIKAGEKFGKMCGAQTMQFAREIILGG